MWFICPIILMHYLRPFQASCSFSFAHEMHYILSIYTFGQILTNLDDEDHAKIVKAYEMERVGCHMCHKQFCL